MARRATSRSRLERSATRRPAARAAWVRKVKAAVKKTGRPLRRRRNASKVPKRVLAGHSAIWGGRIPAGAREQLEKEYARAAWVRKVKRSVKKTGKFNTGSSWRLHRTVTGFEHTGAAGNLNEARRVAKGLNEYSRAQGRRERYKAKKTRGAAAAVMVKGGVAKTRRHPLWNPRNPAEAAAEVYEGFHGRPSSEFLEIKTPVHEHRYLAALGELVSLLIKSVDGGTVTLKKFGKNAQGIPAVLESNEQRDQLFIDGGDQSVDLEAFGIAAPLHESEVLGKAVRIVYYTVKDHLGRDGGEANYKHKFGNQREVKFKGPRDRRYPTVIYDTRNRLLAFAGGIYTIPDEGISG